MLATKQEPTLALEAAKTRKRKSDMEDNKIKDDIPTRKNSTEAKIIMTMTSLTPKRGKEGFKWAVRKVMQEKRTMRWGKVKWDKAEADPQPHTMNWAKLEEQFTWSYLWDDRSP